MNYLFSTDDFVLRGETLRVTGCDLVMACLQALFYT